MKSVKRLLKPIAAFAASLVVGILASPMAEASAEPVVWNDFRSLTAGGITLTIDSSCSVDLGTGVLTIGTDGITVPYNKVPYTIIADVSDCPADGCRSLLSGKRADGGICLTTDSEGLKQMWWTDNRNFGVGGPETQLDSGRHVIALAYNTNTAGSPTTSSYVDGVRLAHYEGHLSNNGVDLAVGRNAKRSTAPTGMKVYRLAVVDRCLTAVEVEDIYAEWTSPAPRLRVEKGVLGPDCARFTLSCSLVGKEANTADVFSSITDEIVFTAREASSTWTYDATANTLSDDTGWVFNTSSSSGITLLSVKTVGSATELDLRASNMDWRIPAIVSVGSSLFKSKTTITKVWLPETLTEIPDSLFQSCSALNSVVLPEGLRSVGKYAFSGCAMLKSMTPFLPTGVTSVGQQAFDGCNRLASDRLTLGNAGSPTTLGTYAFRNCYLIGNLTIGPGITTIPDYCFQNCNGCVSVAWHDSITSLGANAFSGCSALETMTPSPAPASLASIASQAFYQCSKLGGEASFGMNGPLSMSGMHQYAGTRVAKMTFGPGVTSIPSYFSLNNAGLRSLDFDQSVTAINANAFQGCTALETVHLSETLTTLGASAFQGCTSLRSVEPFVPAGLTTLGDYVFYLCSSLEGDLYFATNGASAVINTYALSKTKISRAVLGDNVTEIKRDAFWACPSLSYVKLPRNLQTIGDEALCSCGTLTTVEPFLPESLSGTLSTMFYGDPVVGEVKIGSDDASADPIYFDKYTFYSVKTLTGITFGKNVPKIATSAGVFTTEAFCCMTGVKTVWFLGDTEWGPSEFNNWGNYQARFIVDKDSDYWNGFIADADKCRAPTPEEIASYRAAYPGEPDPRAVTLVSPKNQWIVSYGIVEPGEKNVTVSAVPKLYRPDDVTPTYGLHENVAPLPMTLKSPRYATDGLTILECRGYTVETPTVTGWGNGVTNAVSGDGERSVDFNPAEDGLYRFSWLWEPAGYQAAITLPSDSSIGTVTCSNPGLEGYYAAGSTATFTALPGADIRFVRWHGDVPAGQATNPSITLTMNGPKNLMPEFESPWVYDTVAKTLSDGFWVLNASGTMDAIVVGTVRANYDLGFVDFTKPVKDGGVITGIGISAFNGNKVVRDVRLPDTLKTIADYAFLDCTSLTNVAPCIPQSVTSVGRQAFYACSALASDVRIGFGAEPCTLGIHPFNGCSSVRDAQVGPQVTVLPDCFLQSATSLTNVTLHADVESIGNYAFTGSTALRTVTPFLPSALTSIGQQAFYNCTSLEGTLVLGTSGKAVTLSSNWHFGLTAITNAILGAGVTAVPDCCFKQSKLQNVEMEAVRTIGADAFRECKSLRSAVLPKTLESIPSAAFLSCSELQEVGSPFLPPALTNVGWSAFCDCGKLTVPLVLEASKRRDITFPSYAQFSLLPTVEIVIGRYQTALASLMFNNCKSVRRLKFKGKPTYQSDTFASWTARQAIVYLPRDNAEWMEMLNDAKLVTPWNSLTVDVRETFFDVFGADEPVPYGLASASFNPPNQWVTKWNPNANGTKLVFR